MKLWNYIKDKMLMHPDQEICEETAKMTYEDVVIYVEHISKMIAGEKCCAIICASEMMASIALLACFASNVTAVPLSTRYGKLHYKKILDFIGPSSIITDAQGELQLFHLKDPSYIEPKIHPALIMCTSGTTGKPKGAMLTEENIITNVTDICEYLNILPLDRILIARPLYHCAVLTGEFLSSLVKGVNVRFYSERFNPKIMLDTITEYGITVFGGTPTLLSMMARFGRNATECPLSTICISGECMSSDVGKKIADSFPGADIYHVYGLTEASPRVSYLPPHLFLKNPDCVGVPLKSVTLKIVKSNGQIAEKNEEGILYVKGGNVMAGYYNAPEQTSKMLSNGWLCTGDIAVINSDGLLKIKGRSDDLIIRGGMNIYPQEVEGVLKKDPRVREVLVYKIENRHNGVQVGMKIAGDFACVDDVKKLCSEVLPSFQIPTSIELLDELPKNGSGKIIRH